MSCEGLLLSAGLKGLGRVVKDCFTSKLAAEPSDNRTERVIRGLYNALGTMNFRANAILTGFQPVFRGRITKNQLKRHDLTRMRHAHRISPVEL